MRTALRAVLVGVLAFLVWLSPAAAVAQTDTGSVAGTVVDESGGTLPGVTITVTNTANGQARTTVTNESGRYQITALQPSRYSIKAEIQGFATVLRPEVTVNVGSAIDVNLTMKVSTVEETVTVTGEAPIIESTRADSATSSRPSSSIHCRARAGSISTSRCCCPRRWRTPAHSRRAPG